MALQDVIRKLLDVPSIDEVKADLGSAMMDVTIKIDRLDSDFTAKINEIESGEERVIFPVAVKAFIGSNEITDQITVEGYIRGAWLSLWWDGDGDVFDGQDGRLLFEPDRDIIAELARFGGVGSVSRGFSFMKCERLNQRFTGTSQWVDKHFITPYYHSGERNIEGPGEAYVSGSKVRPDGQAWPFRMRYGCAGVIEIKVP